MNMLNLNPTILKIEFLDNDGNSYSYLGRWCTSIKYDFRELIKFLNNNKIEYHYIYRSKGPAHYAIKVYPSSIESACILFNTPWRKFLFTKHDINN